MGERRCVARTAGVLCLRLLPCHVHADATPAPPPDEDTALALRALSLYSLHDNAAFDALAARISAGEVRLVARGSLEERPDMRAFADGQASRNQEVGRLLDQNDELRAKLAAAERRAEAAAYWLAEAATFRDRAEAAERELSEERESIALFVLAETPRMFVIGDEEAGARMVPFGEWLAKAIRARGAKA